MPGSKKKSNRTVDSQLPRISIICPIFNVRPYIAQTIDTVLKQSYKNWELLIIDGASTDGTLGIVKSYGDRHPNIRVYSEPDEGPWHATDKAFDLAKGEFICFLYGQDGFLDANWLSKCLEVFDTEPFVSLVWALNLGMTEGGEIMPETHVSYSQFIQSENSGNAAFHVVRKFFHVLKDLLFGSKDRKKFLLGKLLSPNAAFKFGLLTNRSFEEKGYPQKEAWLDYWFKTGLVFPDQSMVISKSVFLECVPRYRPGDTALSYMTDFYFNFSSGGYWPYYLPTHASFGRIHRGSSGDRNPQELYRQDEKYYNRIRDFKRHLVENHLLFKFHDRSGNVISSQQF